jgi:hypothetical protein
MVGGMAGRLAARVGERGSKSVFSLMLMIIFSRPRDVMCFSLPLLRLSAESSASSRRRLEFRGNVAGLTVCVLSASSDAAESTLEDNDGTSFALGCRRKTRIAGVVARCGCASQQKVSLFHNLQLRFSSRLPSSIDSAHFEKTASEASEGRPTLHTGRSTYPSTFRKDSPHSSGQPCASWLRPQSGQAQLNAKASRRRCWGYLVDANSVRGAGQKASLLCGESLVGRQEGAVKGCGRRYSRFCRGVLVMVALCAGRVQQHLDSCGYGVPGWRRDQA